MKKLVLVLFFVNFLNAEIFLTPYVGSHHFKDRANGKKWNDNHKYIGLEYKDYGVSTFINSRDNRTYFLWKNFYVGEYFDSKILDKYFHLMGGVQKGYCTQDLKSIECSENKRDYGLFILPVLKANITDDLSIFGSYSNRTFIYGLKYRFKE